MPGATAFKIERQIQRTHQEIRQQGSHRRMIKVTPVSRAAEKAATITETKQRLRK